MGQSSEHQNRDAKLNKSQRNHDKYIYIYIYIYLYICIYICILLVMQESMMSALYRMYQVNNIRFYKV